MEVDLENRVLLVAPTSRDRDVTTRLLQAAGVACEAFDGLCELTSEAERGAGALLLTESALTGDGIDELIDLLNRQPAWSDLPVVMLMHGGGHSPIIARVLNALRNVMLLERPAPMRSVLSAVQAAVRSRRRQYQIRDQMESISEAEAAAVESEGLYRAIGESINYGVWICENNGRNTYASQSFLDLIGMTQEEWNAAGWQRVLHPEDLDATREAWRQCVAAGANWYREHRFLGQDGRWHPVLACGVPVRDEQGRIIKWAGINLDISRLKEAQESERAARLEAERISRMKDEFLATLSHELRTPLNAILGWAQLLRHGNTSGEELRQGLDIIERNARVQTQLIEDLLDMSRIISGKIRLDIQNVEPTAFIEAALETVRPGAEAKGVRLQKVLDPGAGPISGDPNRLQQVVWNLLANAIKFTPKGGRVQVLLARIDSHIEVTVSDTGQGISAEFLPHVFERFRQADSSTTRRHGGLGLGLAIVKQLAELHGGAVRVESDGEGRGSTFVVELPLAPVLRDGEFRVRQHPRTTFAAKSECDHTSLRGLRVLVVDDEPDARELLRRVLENCQAEVVTAASATDALGLLPEAAPDVLVSDIGMPEVDGYEFLRRVRALSPARVSRIPAIALTAFARSEDRTRALLAGYLVHVSKPVEPSELVATVASVAGRTGDGAAER